MVNALLFIIIILLICACLFLSQILWQNEQYHLENNKKLSADFIDSRNERMTSMVHSQFYMNLFWSVSGLDISGNFKPVVVVVVV